LWILETITIEEQQKLLDVIKCYRKLRDLIIYSETLGDQETFAATFTELRNSLDCIMKFHAVKFEIINHNSMDGLECMDSSLQRATIFIFDYITIFQKDELNKLVEKVSYEVLTSNPDMFGKIYNNLDKSQELINKLRSNEILKDQRKDTIKQTNSLIWEIKSDIKKIRDNFPVFDAADKKKKGESNNISKRDVLLVISGAILALILTLLAKSGGLL